MKSRQQRNSFSWLLYVDVFSSINQYYSIWMLLLSSNEWNKTIDKHVFFRYDNKKNFPIRDDIVIYKLNAFSFQRDSLS